MIDILLIVINAIWDYFLFNPLGTIASLIIIFAAIRGIRNKIFPYKIKCKIRTHTHPEHKDKLLYCDFINKRTKVFAHLYEIIIDDDFRYKLEHLELVLDSEKTVVASLVNAGSPKEIELIEKIKEAKYKNIWVRLDLYHTAPELTWEKKITGKNLRTLCTFCENYK